MSARGLVPRTYELAVRISGVPPGRALVVGFPRRWKRRAIVRRPAGAKGCAGLLRCLVAILFLRRLLRLPLEPRRYSEDLDVR